MAQNSGHSDDEFVSQTEISNYICSRSTFADDLTEAVPEIGTYNDHVEEQSDVSFNGIYIRSWGGFICAMKGVDNAASTDPEDIQEGLNTLQMDSLETGLPFGLEFQDNGQNGEASGVLVQFHEGNAQLVWPFDLAQDDTFTFPAPGWNER